MSHSHSHSTPCSVGVYEDLWVETSYNRVSSKDMGRGRRHCKKTGHIQYMDHAATVHQTAAGCCHYCDTTHMFCARDNTQHTCQQRIPDPSLCHLCLPVVLQLVLDALVVGTVQQTSVGGRHTCASTIADEQLQHIGVAWGEGGGAHRLQHPANGCAHTPCHWLRTCSVVCAVSGVKMLYEATASHYQAWQCAYRASH